MTSHTKNWKENQFNELRKLAEKYPVIAIADINMFPADLFAIMRKKLANKAVVKVSKTRVIKKAFEGLKDKEKLSEYMTKSCAIIFTEMNPFELFAFLKKNKGKVSAKEGAIAEENIIIPAGDTGLPPGPALSDLKAAGLKVAVQGPTISIVADKVVTKAGEPVSKAVAGTLSKLNIKPFKVGLSIVAAYEGENVFISDVLDIDTDQVFANFVSAHQKAFNLAFNAGIFTSETTELLVVKAYNDAKAVSIEANIINAATVDAILAKANAQAKEVKKLVKNTVPSETKVENVEEKTEEVPSDVSAVAEETKGEN